MRPQSLPEWHPRVLRQSVECRKVRRSELIEFYIRVDGRRGEYSERRQKASFTTQRTDWHFSFSASDLQGEELQDETKGNSRYLCSTQGLIHT